MIKAMTRKEHFNGQAPSRAQARQNLDHDIAALLNHLEAIVTAHAHDRNLMTICAFLNEVMPRLYHAQGTDFLMWEPTSLRCRDDRRRKETIVKIQKAYQFISKSQRLVYERALGEDGQGQVDFICELAKKIIGMLPSIGNHLDCFLVEPIRTSLPNDEEVC